MPLSVAAWLAMARARLAPVIGPQDAARDARLLLAHVTGWSAARVATAGPDPVPEGAVAVLEDALARRLAREPLAQIIGEWAFHGRLFETTADTLTPRPDTETLVELALSRPFGRCLDLGTGTGAIAITLLADRAGATAVAGDLSGAALEVAARNAARHDVADRLDLVRSDWWRGIDGRFDLIVSNPPYVTQAEYGRLPPEITRFEPRIALTPGGDGLDAYRAIAAGAAGHMAPGGRLLLEIGPDQGQAVAALLVGAGLDGVAIHPDINGKDRVVSAAMRDGYDRAKNV